MDPEIMRLVYDEAIRNRHIDEEKSKEILVALNLLYPLESFSEEIKISLLCLACFGDERLSIAQHLLDHDAPAHIDAFNYALIDRNYSIMDLLLEYGLIISKEDVLHYYNRSLEIDDDIMSSWFAENFPQYI